ncbi:MAG: FtsW/RodA/SpoVE family cell cycle protein [Patescibacteria group bacterium]
MALPVFLRKFDWILTGIVLAILGLGLATFYAMGPEAHTILVRHALFVGAGFMVMVLASFFDYRIFKNYSLPSVILYALAVTLLGFTLASREIRGSSAWLEFFGFQFEPSEFAKLALLILFAKYFSQKHVEIYRVYHIVISGAYLAIPLVMTLLQPDLGSVIVYLALWGSMLLFAGIKRRHLLAILMLGVVAASLSWLVLLKPYQKARIVSFANPYHDARGSGYHTIQSRITLGSGGWTGTYFTHRDNLPVLVPEPYTDFTFATFAQKFGFVGIVVLLALLLGLMARIGSVARMANNNFAKLYTLGFLTIIFTHVLVNGGMNLGLLPITGIPFPFLSHGGSHLVTLMAGLGLIQNIRMRS